MTDIAVAVLLAVGLFSAVLSAAGALLARDFYERLQYLSPVASIGVAAVALAVFVRESFSQSGLKALLIAAVVFAANSAMTHATVRAGHTRKDAAEQSGEDRVRKAGG